MKFSILLLLFVTFNYNGVYAQSNKECLDVSLKKKKIKEAEPCIKQLSDFLLSMPVDESSIEKKLEGLESNLKILKWAEKTDYLFSLNSNVSDVCTPELFGVYLAALAKAAIELKGVGFEKKALGYFVAYIVEADNHVTMTDDLKELVADWKSGNIDKYIDFN